MNKIIDKNNPKPIYSQIADWIREKVLSEEWGVNYQLPSEEVLSKELEVSRGTLRRAISSLIDEEILIQVQGKGTFVVEKKVSYPFGQELVSFAESMTRSGLKFETEVIEKKVIRPNEVLQKKFALEEKQDLFFLKRLRYIDKEPVILIENYINIALCPGIEHINFEKETLFNSIEILSGEKISFGQRKFSAKSLDKQKSNQLALPEGAPILFLDQITYLDNKIPVETSEIWLKSDKYAITSYLQRE